MSKNKNTIWFWLFLAPVLIGSITVIIIPFFMGIYYSFTDWNGIGTPEFIGVTNYVNLLKDKDFLYSFVFTTQYAFVAVLIINVVGFSLALLLTQKIKFENQIRTLFFMPNLIGGLILGFIWQFIFIKIFPIIGMEAWLTNKTTGFLAILIVNTWQMGGYIMIIYIAYLQNIPTEFIEASKIDGASYFDTLKNIIIPLVAPGFTVSMFLTIANSFKMYDLNFSLTGGGPGRTTRMVALNIVETAFSDNRMSYAQAKAVIFFIVVASITLIQAYMNKKREVEL